MLARLIELVLGPVFRAARPVLDHDARLVLTPRSGGYPLATRRGDGQGILPNPKW